MTLIQFLIIDQREDCIVDYFQKSLCITALLIQVKLHHECCSLRQATQCNTTSNAVPFSSLLFLLFFPYVPLCLCRKG